MQEEQEGGNPPKEIKLINSGAFGCIYKPSLTCKGNVGSAKYITKIQKSERSIKNEINISKQIRKISGYVRYFAPVLKYCTVKIKKDRINDMKKCELFENNTTQEIKNTSYASMKTRYVGDYDLSAYLLSNNITTFVPELLRTHVHLLKAIHKLVANHILHFDLKYNNIIFDKELNTPIIIDFGQSFNTDELNTDEQLSTAFFIYDQYDYWNMDILICNYIFQKVKTPTAKTKLVTEAEIDNIWDVFMYGIEPKNNPETNTKKIVSEIFRYSNLQNPQKINDIKTRFNEYLNLFINKRTWWELFEDLMKYSSTWDCYSLSVIYLNVLDDIFLSNPNLYGKILNSSEGKLAKFIELMETVIYSAPNNRPSIKQLLKSII